MRANVLGVLLLAGFALACSEPETAAPGSSSPPPSARRGNAGQEPAAAVDLEALLAPVPEYEGTGRNLFAFGPARSSSRAATTLESVEPIVAPSTTSIPTPMPGPATPSAARLAVKYAGFLEKTEPDGAKAKYAIFLDGNEILAGAEGDMVANRFTVVEIGLESVTVSSQGSNTTQRIPLQSN